MSRDLRCALGDDSALYVQDPLEGEALDPSEARAELPVVTAELATLYGAQA